MVDTPHKSGSGSVHQAPNLAAAIRRARTDAAEHSEVVAELRGAEMARLEILAEAMQPVFAQVSEAIDLFDTGLVPGDRPRYFIDMLAFVEMGHDRRMYRFLQDTRHGRIVLLESEKVDAIVDTITAYVARRLVEREHALTSDRTLEQASRVYARDAGSARVQLRPESAPALQRPRRGYFFTALMFIIELLGCIVLFSVLAALGWFAWQAGWHWWNM